VPRIALADALSYDAELILLLLVLLPALLGRLIAARSRRYTE
jgi:hypothetical protein